MKYRTKLMEEILTNPKAQEMIDYVSQIYGESYVGLWLFQVIGSVLAPIYGLSEQLRYETSPATTTLLIDYWEQEYGIEPDPDMTLEQRRNYIISRIQSHSACTPYRLSNAISAMYGGVPVEVIENTGQNAFRVSIRGAVKSIEPARYVINKMKPAHLIYNLVGIDQINATTEVEAGVAMTQGIKYRVEVE